VEEWKQRESGLMMILYEWKTKSWLLFLMQNGWGMESRG